MINRGFEKNIALLTWFYDVVQALPHRDHPRYIEIKYEDLVKDPAKAILDIFEKVGVEKVSEHDLMNMYKNNSARQNVKRISSWSINSFGKSNAGTKKISKEIVEDFQNVFHLRISDSYAEAFNIEPLTFSKLIEKYGYMDQMQEIGNPTKEAETFINELSAAFKLHISRKMNTDTFINPISSIN